LSTIGDHVYAPKGIGWATMKSVREAMTNSGVYNLLTSNNDRITTFNGDSGISLPSRLELSDSIESKLIKWGIFKSPDLVPLGISSSLQQPSRPLHGIPIGTKSGLLNETDVFSRLCERMIFEKPVSKHPTLWSESLHDECKEIMDSEYKKYVSDIKAETL
jgi:hypothetical protein